MPAFVSSSITTPSWVERLAESLEDDDNKTLTVPRLRKVGFVEEGCNIEKRGLSTSGLSTSCEEELS